MKKIPFIQLKFRSFEIFLICTPKRTSRYISIQVVQCESISEKSDEELFKHKYEALWWDFMLRWLILQCVSFNAHKFNVCWRLFIYRIIHRYSQRKRTEYFTWAKFISMVYVLFKKPNFKPKHHIHGFMWDNFMKP